jgi:hypothetical protein
VPTLSVRMTARAGNPLTSLPDRLRAFTALELKARREAAAEATRVTKGAFRHTRPVPPARAGRDSTGGHLTDFLRWGVTNNAEGGVVFDVKGADSKAPHWIIQEVGTGRSAKISDPVRSKGVATVSVRSIPSQKGRRIRGLVFASGPGGTYSPPGARRGEQLYPINTIRGVPPGRTIRIRREIKGQHMVRKGGQAGFRLYRQQVATAARRTLASRRFTP